MFSLTDLPYEVLSYVIDYLSLQDVYCLGQTSSAFRFVLEEERICKSILQVSFADTGSCAHTKLRNSNEALAAVAAGSGNARNLRRALKRHTALATASPFIVATIGLCDAYLYCKGVLCYTLDDKIRVLNLHHSGQSELVISIPSLLAHALSDINENSKGYFQILYYSDYILSCVYRSSSADSTAWLISFNLRSRQFLVAHELDSTDKIFVRHNKQYLYYGTHSELGTDGYKKWVIYGYDFKTRKWFDQKVHLPDMVGSEIGSTICFELYDGYFYGLSNQTSFEVEEIDWTSFYHCIRFPLSSPCKELLEKTENKSMWRRQHQEGPIDDRWTNLRLVEDESTGELKIVEARKEWYLGSSRSQRTYYTTDLVFPRLSKEEDAEDSVNSPSVSSSDPGLQYFSLPAWVPDSTLAAEEAALSSASSSSSAGTSDSSLAGLKKWGSSQRGMKGVGEGPHVDGRAAGDTINNAGTQSGKTYIDVGEADRTVSIDRKGKGKERCNTAPIVQVTAGCAPINLQQKSTPAITKVGVGRGNWAWKERAMYQDINMGFYFGLDRKSKG
ncbi:uncharacterized protein PAC_03183 [Phialocephala subalpina]|uniref:F-box domain-containing protein n=1 Tax=Phialocephala subalpina TaxID=576137 RepID=A0A1L7WKL7_9HELO|nr:uncharacterized protein PAC_03183 [Phialocephala subalpina]